MKKQNKRTLAIALALTAGSMSVAAAQSTEILSGGGKDMFEMTIFDLGEGYGPLGFKEAKFTLSAALKQSVRQGVSYWSDILAAGAKNSSAVQILVTGYTTEDGKAYHNASAFERDAGNGQ